MNICQVLKENTLKLKKKNITNPHLEAEILLSHILKKPREFLLAHPEKQLTKLQIANYKLLTAKRTKGTPIAYLTGHKQFYGLDFIVNKNVLIPRPETELMVDEALNLLRSMLRSKTNKKTIIADIGAGSGCIIISIIKNLFPNYQLPPVAHERRGGRISNFKFLATDISRSALAVARKNAKKHNVVNPPAGEIKFYQGNLLEPLIKNLEIRNYNLVILANLPYLTPAQIKNSPTIKYEPKIALSADKDGLKYYRRLFKQLIQITNYKLQITIFCEIDPRQITSFKKLIKKYLPAAKIQIKKDLSGRNRLIIIGK